MAKYDLAPPPFPDSVYNILMLAAHAAAVTGEDRRVVINRMVEEFNLIDAAGAGDSLVTLIHHKKSDAADVKRHMALQGWTSASRTIGVDDLFKTSKK